VSISKFPSGKPSATAHRVRRLRTFVLRHTWQPQPNAGTPTDVPVPRKTSSPLISAEIGVVLLGAVLIAVVLS
jgi:hypothetical protein